MVAPPHPYLTLQSDLCRRRMAEYCELNPVVTPAIPAVPDTVSLRKLIPPGICCATTHLENAFLTPIYKAHQKQFAFN